MEQEKPIINCHTHIFTGDYVPPLLARTIIPGPFYFLLPITPFVKIFRWWFTSKKSPYKWRFQPWNKKLMRTLYRVRIALTRYWILMILKFVVGFIILTSIFHETYPWIKDQLQKNNIGTGFLDKIYDWLSEYGILVITNSILIKAVLLIILLLFFPSGRSLIFFLLRKTSKFFGMLPGKTTLELIKRYINIVRFARYKKQNDILTKLANQYPPGTGMVVLPMDMEFMGAGKPPKEYADQMEELAKIKARHPKKIFPFVFVDPRRKYAGKQLFFDYEIINGKVTLKDCFIKDYIETKKFDGFKIYPALGYFPFDEALLPLWKYAAENGIPIMTHCIRGVIYYRGPKEKAWDFHPVFEQAMGKDKDPKDVDTNERDEDDDSDETNTDNNEVSNGYQPLLLPQMKAVDVQEIFTHPLNYACLLKKELLAKVVKQAKDPRIKSLFGYDETTETIATGLDDLKICFGHFGGEDEWARFFEKDRDNFSSQLAKRPNEGIDFSILQKDGTAKRGRPEQLWKYADWYSIICSLMLQHNHVYADISYILHGDLAILPLLRQTIQHPKLKQHVLYGTDFYVVRNHKSDKNMLADMRGGLLKEEFDQVARINPVKFLSRRREEA